jgi:hypothetical protein
LFHAALLFFDGIDLTVYSLKGGAQAISKLEGILLDLPAPKVERIGLPSQVHNSRASSPAQDYS